MLRQINVAADVEKKYTYIYNHILITFYQYFLRCMGNYHGKNHVADYYIRGAEIEVRLRPYVLDVETFFFARHGFIHNLKRNILSKMKSDAQKKKKDLTRKNGLILMGWVV